MAIFQRGTTRTNEQAPVYPPTADPASAPVVAPVVEEEPVPVEALNKDRLLAILEEAGATGYSKKNGKDELLDAVRAIGAE